MTYAPKRSWIAVLLSCLLVFSLVVPALAAPSLGQDDAIDLLREYRIVQGDQTGNLNLDNPITRAELAKIVVFAMGRGDMAPALKDSVSFTDAQGHWAAGFIEMASRLELVKGRTLTTFDPDAQITNAEAYTILLRMAKREPAGPWNARTIMQAAAALDLVPDVPLEVFADLPAIRGNTFRALASTLVNVTMPDGSTVGKKFLDSTAPTLTLNDLSLTGNDDKATVSGNVVGADKVTVNGEDAPLSMGRFTATVSLQMGTNTIRVVASDLIGNTTTETRTVSRSGLAARIEVSGEGTVKAGQSVKLNVTAYDAQNNALPASAVTATVAGNQGSFNSATGTFTAGNQVGTATITFKADDITKDFTMDVLGLSADARGLRIRSSNLSKGLTIGKAWTVEVEVVDEESNVVTYDDGRVVTLSATGLSGVTIANPSVRTVKGVATFTVSGTTEGEASLVAAAGGLATAGASVVFTTNQRIVLTADPNPVVANGTNLVVIRATLQDEGGNPVSNTSGEDIYLTMNVPTFDGYAGGQYLVIRRGNSSSAGYDGQLISGYKTESLSVNATITSNHKFSVVPTTVSFREVTLGSATKFELVGGQGSLLPGGGRKFDLVVRVTDSNGNTVPTGNFAFQIKASTSNNEDLVGGMPSGLDVTLGDTAITPVVDADGAVTARTTNGTARLTLTYDKSGIVNLEVVGARATDDAYSDLGSLASASSGTSLKSGTSKHTFIDTVTQVKVRVDLPGAKLNDQPYGVLPANSRGVATVKVYLLDAAGGWVPTANTSVILARQGISNGTRLNNTTPDTMTVAARNGVAEFPITSTSNVDVDTWEADAGLGAGAKRTILIATDDAALSQPSILNITGDTSHEDNRVTLDDAGMLIDIGTFTADTYGYVKVYRSSSSTPVYTSNVLDLSAAPSVLVPKSSLPNADRYSIAINNGFADSPKSYSWPDDTALKVVVEKAINVTIKGVRYDANAVISGVPYSQLIVSASGVASNGFIDSSKLSLYQTVTTERLYLDMLGATCTPSSSSFTCTFSADALDPSLFTGSVILDTENGWYTRDAYGETAARDEVTTDNRVAPTANIDYATVTFTQSGLTVTGVLSLHGTNLNQGRINLSKITVGGFSVGTSTITPTSSSKVDITLPSATASSLNSSASAVTLEATVGWLYANSSDENASLSSIPVYVTPKISSVTYNATSNTLVITGSGFTGATIDATKLRFVNRRGTAITELNDLVGALSSSVAATDDTTFVIDLTTLADTLETTYNGTAYLTSVDVSPTNGYWYEAGNGWYGATMGRYRLSW